MSIPLCAEASLLSRIDLWDESMHMHNQSRVNSIAGLLHRDLTMAPLAVLACL